jgi:hypothetical protein
VAVQSTFKLEAMPGGLNHPLNMYSFGLPPRLWLLGLATPFTEHEQNGSDPGSPWLRPLSRLVEQIRTAQPQCLHEQERLGVSNAAFVRQSSQFGKGDLPHGYVFEFVRPTAAIADTISRRIGCKVQVEAFGRHTGRRPADSDLSKLSYPKTSLFHRLPTNGLDRLFVVLHPAGNRFHQLLATTEIHERDTSLAHHERKPPFRVIREHTR